MSESNPYTSPFTDNTGQHYTTTRPFGLGCPCSPDGIGDCGCSGPPTEDDPFPTINAATCARVGIVPILAPGSFAACNGNCTVTIVDFAVFYLIGIEEKTGKGGGNQGYVVGAFLKDANLDAPAAWGKDLDGPRGYYLWR